MLSNQELPTVSPLSDAVLRKRPERFVRILGITVTDFDLLVERLKALRLATMLKRRVLWDLARVQRLHERTCQEMATDVCITLLYQRQYMTQEVLAACFAMEQGSICTIIRRTEALLVHSLPTPEHLSDALATTIEVMPAETFAHIGLSLVLDGVEQPTQRPQNDAQQRAQYSGKKKVHTLKTQVVATLTGLILHLAPTMVGTTHDFKQAKHDKPNEGLRRMFLLAQNKVKLWCDSAYQGIAKRHPLWQCFVSRKARRNHPLTWAEKQTNKARSKVRVVVEHHIRRIKVYRICSDRLRKASRERHQRRWNIAAGLANLRWMNRPEFAALKQTWL